MDKGGSHTKNLVAGQENVKHGRIATFLDDHRAGELAGYTHNTEGQERHAMPESRTTDIGSGEKVSYENIHSFHAPSEQMAGLANSSSPHPWAQTSGKRDPQCESFDSTTISIHHERISAAKYGGSFSVKEHQMAASTSSPSMSSAAQLVTISSTAHQNNNNVDKTDTIPSYTQRTSHMPQSSQGLQSSGPAQLYSSKNATTSLPGKLNPGHPNPAVYTSQGNPQTMAHTSQGNPQTTAHTSQGNPQTVVYTSQGNPQMTAHTSQGNPQTVVYTSQGNPQTAVYTSQGNPQTLVYTSQGNPQTATAAHPSHEGGEGIERNLTGSGRSVMNWNLSTVAQSSASAHMSDSNSRTTKTGVSLDSCQDKPVEAEASGVLYNFEYIKNTSGLGKKTTANNDAVKYSGKTLENLHQFKLAGGRSATTRPGSFFQNFDSCDTSAACGESFHVQGENSSSSEAHHFVSNKTNQQHAKPKKARSRGSKKKNSVEKLPVDNINDEDDDNDFIPVGMLQLSTAKRPESTDSSFQAGTLVCSETSGDPSQFNQGLQIQYQVSNVQIKPDPGVSQYDAAVHENNILLQQELQNQLRFQDQLCFQKQEQPGILTALAKKPAPASPMNPHQTGSQLQQLAQSVAAHQPEQQTEQTQQQYLLQLVQQAQQQQKQLLVQQQKQQLSSTSGGDRSKNSGFHKNQGLIIHHQQLGVGSNVVAQGMGREGNQKSTTPLEKHQINQSQQLVRDYTVKTTQLSHQQSIQEQVKNASLERNSTIEQQPLVQRLQQQETGSAILESSKQTHGSGGTKLTEQLLQQNKVDQILQQSKMEQDSLGRQNIISRRDQPSLRSVTPTLVHHNPPLNQQHPEIAKMLNSPVSPRQPASPRQSVSPRRTVSPHPSSISPCHFVSPYPRQTNSPRQSSKQTVPHSSTVRHSASPQPKQPVSPRQPASPWQPVSPSQPSPASPSLQQPQAKTGQTVASYLLSDHKLIQQQKHSQSHLGQPVTINLEKMRLSGDVGLGLGTQPDQTKDRGNSPGSQISLSQQLLPEKACSVTELHCLPISISSSQPAEVFSPGQIIHHRPQEQKKSRHGHSQGKSRSPGGIMTRLATPSVLSSNVPVPSAENASPIWQHMQPKGNKSHTQSHDSVSQLSSVESSPQASKPLGLFPSQMVDVQGFVLQDSPSLQTDSRLLDQPVLDQFSQQQYRREEVSTPSGDTFGDKSHQHLSSDKPTVEMQLYPSVSSFYQPQKLTRETKSLVNSLIMQPAQDFQPQCTAGLTEKETSLIQSLFADHSNHETRRPINSQTGQFETGGHGQAYSESQPTRLSDMSRSEDGLKFLSEIASERYVLAVAGKDETGAPQNQESEVTVQTKSSENFASSSTNEETKPLKAHEPSIKTGNSASVVFGGEVANAQNSSGTKEKESPVKESEVANRDTPRREVRQRKPKKPFEQEDTPTRRSAKAVTPGQKHSSGNSNHKKQNSLQTLPNKKGPHLNKQPGKVSADTEEVEHGKDKTPKEADHVPQRSATPRQEKIVEDKLVSHEEESETDSMTDSANRRLSQRLRVREKEKEIYKSDADDSTRRSKRRSTRIDYKEEASDSVEENPSNRGRKISPSYSSSEDTAAESKPRMTTRSKNRKDELPEKPPGVKHNKESESAKDEPSEKPPGIKHNKESESEDKPSSKKRKDDVPEDTAIHRTRRNDQSKHPEQIKSTPGSNSKTNSSSRKANSAPQANRAALRDKLRSPASRSRSPVTSRSTSPDNAGTAPAHRMTTRRLVAETEYSQPNLGSKPKRVTPSEFIDELPVLASKPKRVAPSEFIDELPVLRKRTKKTETQATAAAETQAQKNQEDKREITGSMPAVAPDEVAHVADGLGTQKPDSKSRSHKKKKRPIRTNSENNALPSDASNHENNVEMKEDEKVKDSKSDLENVLTTPQKISNKLEAKDVISHSEIWPSQEDMTKQEAKPGSVLAAESLSGGKPDMSVNHLEAPAPETPELRIKQLESLDIKTKLRNRVVESSSRNASKQSGESSVITPGRNSAGFTSYSSPPSSQKDLKSRVDHVQPQKDGGSMNVENARQKMVMYKLVPVLGEDMSDLEVSEGLVPISGFFVSRGSCDRILLPHNFMNGPLTSKMSSKASEFRVGPNRKSNSSSIISSSWSPQAGDPTLSARKSGLSSDPQSVSAFAPLKSIPRSNQTSVQSSSSGLLQSSQWMDQSPQSVATPPPSTGEPMSIATKKNWTASQPQASPAYRRSPSWNATPPSILSSSPLSSSSSAWTLSSSSAAAPPQSSQSWSGPHHSTPQDPSWRVSPSVTNAGVESWGKDYFPNPSLTDSRRQDAVLTSPIDPTVQNFSGHQHYGSLESTLYSAQHDEPLNTNNATYGTGSQPDTDLTETRQENLIQGFLRHVSANTASFNQELSGFNLGQQDFAYLERGLRQALSPTALLSAVEAYDDSGQDTGACQDSSLQDSINLVHTVNLDMEEGNLDGSSNLGLVNLNGHPATQVNIPRNMDGLTKTSQSGMQSLMESDLGSTTLNDSTSSIDGTSLVGSPLAKGITDGEEKKEEKKAMKERKHQYDIIVNDGVRKFKCKICNKSFGKTTIYRHLRIHDSDYRISCTLCEKQYTQKHSLMLHMQKFHGEVNTSLLSPDKKDPGDTAVKEEDKTSPNKPSEAKRQRRSSSTADPLAASLDENELLKQKETHRQVEELRRLKAEKKAHGKSGLHSADDASARDDGLSPCKEGEGEFPVKNFGIVRAPLTGHQTNITELSNTVPDRTDVDNSVGYKGASGGSLGPQVGSSQTAPQILSGSKPQFQLNSPLPVMSTIAPFQTVDPALKPVSTPATGTPDEIPNNWDTAPGVASEKSFPSQADLKNFLCTVCNTQLVSRNGFTLHMRRHNVAKSKLCTSCDKKFHTTTELKTHMRTHTGERPFKCELCYMSFAHSGSFVCHKKGHTNRGELEPFPIIDGQIKYPSTFRKPRMEGIKKVLGKGGDQKKEPKKKTNNESQEVGGHGVSDAEPSSIPRQDSLSGGHHTSVIRKNSLDGSFEKHAVSSRNDSDLPRKLGLNSQDMNSSGDGVMGLSGQIFNPNVPASSRVKDGGGYLQAGDGYSTPQQDIVSGYSTPRHDITSSYSTPRPDVTGGYSTPNQVDYYSGQSGYSETSQQRNFLSPQAETSSSHSYYNQEKYYARAASGDQFSPGSSSGQLRSVPVNLVVDKSQHYSEGMQGEYPESVETADGYYSSQQPYQYAMPPGDADYEQEDYDGALSQYKGDPSSSEIVKKLLQHYNVPSSTYQEAAPLDYSHQLQGAPDYSRASGETAPPIYAEQELGVAAPPSYSASVQQKQFYGSHTNTPEYDGTLMMSSDRAAPLPSPQGSSLQTAQERSYSRSTASIQQAEAYSLEPRYSTADNFHDGQYARSPSQPYTQTYEVTSRDYYQQGLPKIESLARDTDPNSRDPVTKSQ